MKKKMGNIRKRHSGAFKGKVAKEIPLIFTNRKKKAEKDREELEAELYRQIGQLKVELDWLKKKFEILN